MRLSMLLALMPLAACGDDGGATLDQGQPDMAQVDLRSADAAPDTTEVPDLAPPDLGPTPPTLIDTHTGWKQALCFTCHAGSTYPHGSQSYKEPDCAQCHGYNGAPHKSHATMGNSGCMNCHSSTSHASSFTAPADCVACHFHPG